jgi:hypothetical protein
MADTFVSIAAKPRGLRRSRRRLMPRSPNSEPGSSTSSVAGRLPPHLGAHEPVRASDEVAERVGTDA